MAAELEGKIALISGASRGIGCGGTVLRFPTRPAECFVEESHDLNPAP